MLAIVSILYGVYFIVSGIQGNAPTAAHMLGQEGQFVYWIIVLMVLMALWETSVGAELARPLAVLIVLGWLLHQINGVPNYKTLGDNAKALLPAL